MALLGYLRVSTEEQNTTRQEDILADLGVEDFNIYCDKMSGKNQDRPELKAMLAHARSGDIVVVESISRLARNTRDLLYIVDEIEKKGANLKIQKESVDTATPQGRFMLTIFGAMAELEREYMLQRQREGIAVAKREDKNRPQDERKYAGRKPAEYDKEVFINHYNLWKSGEISGTECMKRLEMKKTRFYKLVKDHEYHLGLRLEK